MKKKRYSNMTYDEGTSYFTELFGQFGSSGGSSSGWTPQNTVDVINSGNSTLQTILTSIFGRNNVQQANYTTELYRQEQRTNTILWVVIGLVLALIVFLVIRKSK